MKTSLGKGKIIIFGSSEYFTAPMLRDPDTRNILSNTILWGNKKAVKILLMGGSDTLQQLFKERHFPTVSDSKSLSDPSVNILLLTKDITDSTEMEEIEIFVRRGGTLIFGSPLAKMFSADPQSSPSLHLNELFTKAGVYHSFNPSEHTKASALEDSIPYYLHINTILKELADNDTHYQNKGIKDAVTSSISLAVYFADTSLTNEIKESLGYSEDNPIVPSEESPIYKDRVRSFLKYELQSLLFARKVGKAPNPYYIAPASKIFPGGVSPAAPRVTRTIEIPVKTGAQGLLEPRSPYHALHSTGLYVPAGEKVTVSIADDYVDKNLKIRIGVHDDNLLHMDRFVREPYDLTSSFDITKDTTVVYSPYGGILYLSVPDTSHLKVVTLKIGGAVKYPYFKSGITNVNDWRDSIRNFGAPWAELATDKVILTVPAERIRTLEDPEKLMRFWDEVLDADAALANIPSSRTHPERIIIDKQVAFGYMFTSYQKIVAPDDLSCIYMLDEEYMRLHGSWGHFHELGHRHQFWGIDFQELGEVTTNLYTMYVFDKVLGKGIYNHEDIPGKEAVINKIKKYMAEGADFKKWSEDPFLALCMYIEIIEGFGWQAIEKVHRVYRALPKERYPSTEEERRDYWFKMICNATQKNLSVFFDKWAVPVSDKARREVSGLPQWLPDELK
ncbi:M60 family metallopeptidase [Chitinophaga tropicalis]|uniref:M60 family metallopeptidase n=1 Tax=Chitinophaga tropicalis TaxID=2683588 RepID=UPI0012F974DD|nr:M60 family metallopeptidase [Chitinophaga tropicalis]